MFLNRLRENNPALIDFARYALRRGELPPNTYILDRCAIHENAQAMLNTAKENNVHLYFMLKQLGRNPLIGQMLDELGFDGAVAVDADEALSYLKNGVHLAHAGHLVQIPQGQVEAIVAARPEVITVYSVEKAAAISEAAGKLGSCQPVMLRVYGPDSPCYPGQSGGFSLDELDRVVTELEKLPHVKIAGVTAFPCFLYDEERTANEPTPSVKAVLEAKARLESRGYTGLQVNLPSATCCATIPRIAALGGTHGEPGHGLTGTTLLHAATAQPERVGYLYLTEVSHNAGGKACCYGGGYYRRGHLKSALCGGSAAEEKLLDVMPVSRDNIDYYFELSEPRPVGEPVILCFRTQIFTTRSRVAVVDTELGQLLGVYTALGEKIG